MKIVKKFGGTSLKDKKSRIIVINNIVNDLKKGNKQAVIVSAIGRYPDCFSTDNLISIINDNILSDDYKSKKEYLKNLDLMMSQGENISSIIIASMLESVGIKAVSVNANNLGIITDDSFGNANIESLNIKYINHLIDRSIIPIITGFQGITNRNDITTLGRGGSDLTAVIIGQMIEADLIEIYTDVDGVMTDDPKVNKNSKLYSSLSCDKLIKMSQNGAKVIHEKAARYLKNINIDLVIKNTFSNSKGTLISNDSKNIINK